MWRKRREESYVRDGGTDGGMPVLIRVWEQRLSVRCLPVNEPVSLPYHRDRAGTQGGGRERAAANLTTGMCLWVWRSSRGQNKGRETLKTEGDVGGEKKKKKEGIKCQLLPVGPRGWTSVISRLPCPEREPICREFVTLHPPASAAPIQSVWHLYASGLLSQYHSPTHTTTTHTLTPTHTELKLMNGGGRRTQMQYLKL